VTDELDVRRRRALYRAAHRGTKEMDWLLGRYAADRVPLMDSAALDHFEQLLAVSDVELHGWILDPARVAGGEFEASIIDMRRFHAL
jgi:antitoxin CptB